MSGIVGLVSLDGTPVDERLLHSMTDSIGYRGPDRRDVWFAGPVGFGHTLLRTTIESGPDRQPTSLDGRVWITADARLDGRADLVGTLESRGRKDLRSASDAQLILHAYHAWGESCLEHLLGDFAFAIWDARTRRLFCARDHFGVKPFYYAHIGGSFVFSNTLDCIRLHPAVGDALNEAAVGDFLLFGYNAEPTTTTFAHVQRLAPAHSLTCGESVPLPARYWTLPRDGRIRYRHSQEYVDHFREILRAAVADRLTTSHVGVWMSGGLDSTSITATARQVLFERTADPDVELRAHTIVYDTLIPDQERRFSQVAAEALGVEISYFIADDYRPLDGWDRPDLWTSEPADDPFLLMRSEQLQQTAAHCRVLLWGQGGDEIFRRSDVADLLSRMRWRDLGADIVRSLVFHRRRPGAGIRSHLKKWWGDRVQWPPYPSWLNKAFADRLNLPARWHQVTVGDGAGDHPLRPEAYRRLSTSPWCFEFFDPGVTRIPIEPRYPFLDVRLVSYLLAIPPLPWCIDKELLRLAMRGALPESIRLRRKAPLAGDPLRAQLRRARLQWWDQFDPTPELAQYVCRAAVPQLASECDDIDPWQSVRPLCLDYWLRHRPEISVRGTSSCRPTADREKPPRWRSSGA